jgi:chromosome segregation ATPase
MISRVIPCLIAGRLEKMQKVLSYETVAYACSKLKQDGEKITGRSVIAITGGSFGTVLKYIKQWRQKEQTGIRVPEEIPEGLQHTIVQALWQSAQDATAAAKTEIGQAEARTTEAMDALCKAEEQLATISEELAMARTTYIDFKHQTETEKALLLEKITVEKNKSLGLDQANKEMTEQLSAAKIELAEQRQVMKYTEGSLQKLETKVDIMQQKIDTLTKANTALEMQNAIAAQKIIDVEKHLQ